MSLGSSQIEYGARRLRGLHGDGDWLPIGCVANREMMELIVGTRLVVCLKKGSCEGEWNLQISRNHMRQIPGFQYRSGLIGGL